MPVDTAMARGDSHARLMLQNRVKRRSHAVKLSKGVPIGHTVDSK